ncbi:MAG: caspase family protein [Hyphomicrobiales bacterium]
MNFPNHWGNIDINNELDVSAYQESELSVGKLSKLLSAGSVAFIATFIFSFSTFAQTNHAIIVGVSKYENLPEDLWLSGPKNDAVLVRDFLISNSMRSFESSNIQVLADGVEGAQIPTLAAIRSALKNMATKAESGDFVYLHFSGHGTQAPAIDPTTEIDGLDELFLPADIGVWDNTVGTVKNALVDDELGRLIDAIRSKGTDIWAVFDSCHSGTVTRAANFSDPSEREVSRQLSPSALGISDAILGAAQPVTRGLPVQESGSSVEGFTDTAGTDEGSFVAFYAAQTNQTTPELRLPEGKFPREEHGLFTFSLLEAIAQNPSVSYRQLGQELLRKYSAMNRVQPTPLFEGDLDLGVFSSDQAAIVQQWPVTQVKGEITINAGRLHGLSEGEILGMVKSAGQSDIDEDVKFKVRELTDLKATLLPVSNTFVIVESDQFARKIETGINYDFTVATPLPEEMSDRIQAIVGSLGELKRDGLRLEITGPSSTADVQLMERDNALWFIGRDGILLDEGTNKTPSITIEGKTSDDLLAAIGENLARMARVKNVVQLGGIFRPSAMGVDVVFTAQNDTRTAPFELDSSAVSQLIPGDIVFLKAKNTQSVPVDMNVLYIGSDFSITHLYSARLNSNDGFNLDLFDITGGSLGRERIMVVATPAAPQSVVEDLSWLAQPRLERRRGQQSELGAMLAEAGFASTTRGVSKRRGAGGGIAQFIVEVTETLR